SPAFRKERDNCDCAQKRANRTKGAKDAKSLVPEASQQQDSKQPFGNAKSVCGSSDSKHRIHPEDQRPMSKKRPQTLRLVIEPLLVAEDEVDENHRRSNHMVIQVSLEDPHFGNASD